MSKKYPHTFNSWQKEECGEVVLLPPDSMGPSYQSQYLFQFNYLRDRGWFKRNKKWIDPEDGKEYSKIVYAYAAQRYKENILKK